MHLSLLSGADISQKSLNIDENLWNASFPQGTVKVNVVVVGMLSSLDVQLWKFYD